MRFDAYWADEDSTYSDGRGDKPMPPDGRHAGEIVDAQIKRLPFKKSDKNPDGTSLVVKVELSKYQTLEDITAIHFRGKIEAIARAAGVRVPTRGEEWDEEWLIGRTVTVDTLQAVSPKGTQYVRIEKWHASPSQPLPEAPPAAKQAPARSQTQKAHREFTSNAAAPDDIPF